MNRAEYDEAVSKCPNHPHGEGPFHYCGVKGCPWTEEGPLDGFDDEPPRWKPRYLVQKAPGVGGDPIPHDEPCLVIRAQDRMARPMLSIYLEIYQKDKASVDPRVVAELTRHYEVLADWQNAYPERVKAADR